MTKKDMLGISNILSIFILFKPHVWLQIVKAKLHLHGVGDVPLPEK